MVQAAELKVLSVNGVKLALPDLIREFERTTGDKVTVGLGEAGILRKRIEEGEAFDVCILPLPATEQLVKQGRLIAGSTVDFVRAPFGMGVRRGEPKPDSGSLDAFRDSLLAVRSVVYTDPATGGVSGVFFARVLENLGIADAVKAKSRLTAGVLNAEHVAKGEADIAVQMRHEILAVPGVDFVAFPSEYQSTGAVVFVLGMGAATDRSDAAGRLIEFLTSPAAAAVITAKEMEPATHR